MSATTDCPNCGARCRVESSVDGGSRLKALQDRTLVAKIEQLQGALQRLRAAAKASGGGGDRDDHEPT